jgi:outer membrane usher protein
VRSGATRAKRAPWLRHGLLAASAICTLSAGAQVAPAVAPPATSFATASGSPSAALPSAAPELSGLEQRVVAVVLNDARLSDWMALRTAQGDLLVRSDDLKAAGLVITAPVELRLDGEDYVSLSGIDGLRLEIDERSQTARLLADPSLFGLTHIEARTVTAIDRSEGNSGFFNWAVNHSRAQGLQATGLSTEAGLRLGPLLLQTSGASTGGGAGRFTRLMTQLTWDRPASLQRWTAGDLVAIAPELGQGALLGGLSVASRFEMEPSLLRYPLGVLQGRAIAASEVDVYVDGQRVRTERVRPGEFAIQDLVTQQGARSVRLVVRDDFGRTQTFEQSLYTSDQLLRPGLHEYQYAIGALRQQYGVEGSAYGPLAYAAFHRVGLSHGLTAGLRAEGRPGLANAGAQLTASLGEAAGVVSAALGASRSAAGTGHAALLRYTYMRASWGVGASLRRDSTAYAGLSDDPSNISAKQFTQLYASRQWGELGTVWLAAQRSQFAATPAGSPARLLRSTSVGYTVTFPARRMSLRLGLADLRDDRGHRVEATLGISFYLDGHSAFHATARADRGASAQGVQYSRAVPIGEGWGMDLSAEHAAGDSSGNNWRASGQWNAPQAVLSAELRGGPSAGGIGGAEHLRVGASGGLVWLGGRLHVTRPVHDSFALVRVGALADVPVALNGSPMGQTDARGEVLLPAITSYAHADVSLDAQALPLDVSVPALRRRFLLPPRGGAVIDFPITRIQAVTARLIGPNADGGNATGPWPLARVSVRVGDTPLDTFTGRDGDLYLENLRPGRYEGHAMLQARRCRFVLEVPARDDALIETGPLVCGASP